MPIPMAGLPAESRDTVRTNKVTAAKADRVIVAIASLIECDDFRKLDTDGTALRDLDRAADHARRMRDERKTS